MARKKAGVSSRSEKKTGLKTGMVKVDLDRLPSEEEEIAKLNIDFPRLADDSRKGCPHSMADIRRYVKVEGGNPGTVPDLFWGRTALVGDVRFWLWGYTEDDGDTVYVHVSERDGYAPLSLDSARDLTPEQFMALEYVRWWRGRDRAHAGKARKRKSRE